MAGEAESVEDKLKDKGEVGKENGKADGGDSSAVRHGGDNSAVRDVVGAEAAGADSVSLSSVNTPQSTVKTEKPGDSVEEKNAKKTEDILEKFDLSEHAVLSDEARNALFEEGLQLDQAGNKTEALQCYLKCLVGLTENSRFTLLPQCLRNIGDIYYGRDEYEKAISFVQAEKLYYESVLIDESDLQKHVDEVTSKGGAGDGADGNIDVLRASEFEQLARLCMDEKQAQLALEYAGKATKLRQKVYGDGHPAVQQSLDYFATVYAEVGKVQYTESMNKFDTAGEPDMSGNVTPATPTEPASILRKRKSTEGDKEKRVRFDETQVPSEVSEREERCALTVLLILCLSLLLVLVVLGIFIFCKMSESDTCSNFRTIVYDIFMRLRFWYYYYIAKSDSKYM